MARAKEQGNGKLEEAMTALVQAQAIMVQTQAAYLAQKAETDKWVAEIENESLQYKKEITEWQHQALERFARIEAILIEHNRILRALPDAIGEKIGFKTPKPPTSEG